MKLERHTSVWGAEGHLRCHLQEHCPQALRRGSHWPATHRLGHAGWPVGPRNPALSSQCSHNCHTQLFMWVLWIKLQSLLWWGKLFTDWSVSSAPRIFFIGRILNYWFSLLTHHRFSRNFFFLMLSWLQHVFFWDLTHFISFHNLLGYNCESILDPRGLLGSLTALQPRMQCSPSHL